MRKKFNLQSYRRELKEIKMKGLEWGLSNEEINFAFEESFLYLREKYPNLYLRCSGSNLNSTWMHSYFFKIIFFTFAVALILLGLNYHRPTHNFVERNIQEIIYPFMKLYRRLTLPIVRTYPSLSGLYDESCLLENPYFQVTNMDCWPCENIKFVLNLTDSKHKPTNIGLPFIIKADENVVKMSDIQSVFNKHSKVFNKDAERIQSNNHWTTAADLFAGDWTEYQNLHVSWRINRMEPARILRSILGLPKSVPNYETSVLIERFLLYDGPKSSSYQIPATEGANVFLKQLSGQRLILLEPTMECLHSCQRLSILLQEQHILWYNWWYWRPRSLPVMNSTEGSLALLGSTV